MSNYHFARAFKRAFGLSPLKHLARRRVEHAKKMIAGNESLAGVASSCGFASQSHMNVVFQAVLGEAPGAYRRRIHSRKLFFIRANVSLLPC